MKRVFAILLAMCLAILPTAGALAEEVEVERPFCGLASNGKGHCGLQHLPEFPGPGRLRGKPAEIPGRKEILRCRADWHPGQEKILIFN